eukprot:g33130.t1
MDESQELHLALKSAGLSRETDLAAVPLRVEVRGTAGRALLDRSIAVGAKAECDVQVFGDEEVLPLQFLVCSLPCGHIIADISGRTALAWRSNPSAELAAGSVWMIPPEERVVLQAFREDFPAKKCQKSSSASTSCGSLYDSKPDIYSLRSDSPISCI